MTLKELTNTLQERKTVSSIIRNVCGKQIGSGLNRDVYEVNGNSRYVIKIERAPKYSSFSNAAEWRNYVNATGWDEFQRWLAPCYLINETGQVMVQARVAFKPIGCYPKQIPSVFTDKQIENYGWIGERFVCCDYSYLLIGEAYKMKRASWWSVKDKLKKV